MNHLCVFAVCKVQAWQSLAIGFLQPKHTLVLLGVTMTPQLDVKQIKISGLGFQGSVKNNLYRFIDFLIIPQGHQGSATVDLSSLVDFKTLCTRSMSALLQN